MIDTKISDLAAFANELADLSTPIAKKYFRLPNGEIVKDDKSPVTLADREIEEALRAAISKKFPNHGVIGEEYDDTNPDSDYQWIIDPIDGTASFIIGRPTFGTLIALAYKKEVQIGIVNQPISSERWLGVMGEGAWFNGKAIKSRDCEQISNAIISTTSQFFFEENDLANFQKLAKSSKYQRFGGVIYGGDCYAYALLASGFLDIIIEPSLKIYDYAALLPIIKMAGGFVGDWEGNEVKFESSKGKIIACGSEKVYREVLKIINEK